MIRTLVTELCSEGGTHLTACAEGEEERTNNHQDDRPNDARLPLRLLLAIKLRLRCSALRAVIRSFISIVCVSTLLANPFFHNHSFIMLVDDTARLIVSGGAKVVRKEGKEASCLTILLILSKAGLIVAVNCPYDSSIFISWPTREAFN